jgi:L-lactate dehydrogenase complex protein LldG
MGTENLGGGSAQSGAVWAGRDHCGQSAAPRSGQFSAPALKPNVAGLVYGSRSREAGETKLSGAMAQTAGAALTEGRDAILRSLNKARRIHEIPPPMTLPASANLRADFIAKAKSSVAQIHEIMCAEDAPAHIASVLRASGAPLQLHIPAASPLNALPWKVAAELTISAEPPGGDQSALSAAYYGIAETGTLVFLSGPRTPSSWHFRPGREFVLIDNSKIVARFEDVIAGIKPASIPATINLITGPSRTADIEQTIEMGAHGPREVHILLIG